MNTYPATLTTGMPSTITSSVAVRVIQALTHHNGRLELLQPIDLPEEKVITVTLDVPVKRSNFATVRFPVRDCGPMKQIYTREELYDESF